LPPSGFFHGGRLIAPTVWLCGMWYGRRVTVWLFIPGDDPPPAGCECGRNPAPGLPGIVARAAALPAGQPENALIVGWRRDLGDVLAELNDNLPPGSKVTLFCSRSDHRAPPPPYHIPHITATIFTLGKSRSIRPHQ